MGDHNRSRIKLGYHISTKIISILLVLLLTTTAFSSIVVAQGPTDQVKDKINQALDNLIGDDNTDESSKGAVAPSLKTKLGDVLKELSILKRERTPIFSIVTKYNGTEITTPLKRLLPTAIDVDGDGDKDIRVWVFRFPGIDLRPPAACIKTTLLVRRLNDDIKSGPFEIYLEFAPKIISKNTNFESIRIGYQTPAGQEVPKYCIVTHKNIPHLLYPRLKTTHRIAINPGPAIGKSQINLVFSIVNETSKSELTTQVNHNPAVRNEISFSLSRDYFIRRGQTLEISRKNVVSSNVSLFIKDVMGIDSSSLTIKNLPKRITLSWLLARKGYVELDTHGSSTGKVEAVVNGVISLGFKPETSINFRLAWETPGLRNIVKKGKSFDIGFDASASATLSNLYVDIPNSLGLAASVFSLNLKGSANAGKVVLKPIFGANTVNMELTNVDVKLENCTIDLKPAEVVLRPTISIIYPEDGDTVKETIKITGVAVAPAGRTINLVQISIDDGDWINLSADGNGNWSYYWDTTTVPNGDYTIYAQCFDSEGFKSKDPPVDVSVIANNPGNNWYPLVSIESPSLFAVLFNDIVTISGTASDQDGNQNLVKVEIKIDDGEWITAQGTTSWSYEWDTTSLKGGFYTISARSYDGTDYSTIATKKVFVRYCNVAEFNLLEASIDVTNFEIKLDDSLGNITDVAVSSFVASGSGSLVVSKDSISLEASGSLNIQDTSISITNETSVTTKVLDNLDMEFIGNGAILLSKSVMSLDLNASVHVHVDEVFGIKNITLGLNGIASAKISFDESGKIILGEDKDSVIIDVKDIIIAIEGIISAGADRIFFSGTGDISIGNEKLIVNGLLNECTLDNFYINTDLGILYLSGSVDFSKTGTLSLDFVKSLSFNLSYTGESSLEITNVEFKIRSNSGNVSASANTITVDTGGYAEFSYYKENADAVCSVDFSSICISSGLTLTFDDRSLTVPFEICGSGSFKFSLIADILIEQGADWIRITIGGNGNAHIVAYATLSTAENEGYLDVDIELATGDDNFVIYLYNLKSDNKGFDIDGGASVNLNKFDMVLKDKVLSEDIVNISIENLRVGFDLDASGGSGSLMLIVNQAGISLDNGHVSVNLKDEINFLLEGTVDVTMSAGLVGTMEFEINETGLKDLNVNFTGDVNIEITDLTFAYVNTVKSTNIALEVGFISINGNADIRITKDYIEAGIGVGEDTKSQGDTKESKESQDQNGILINDFMFSATLASLDFNVIVEFDVLHIVSGVRINLSSDGITISTSADLTAEDVYFIVESDSNAISIDAYIDSFNIAGNGGGKVIIDKNFSLISGSSTNTDIVIKNASMDVRIDSIYLWLMLVDADVSFVGSNAKITIDLSKGLKNLTLVADVSGNSNIAVNTLWTYLSYTFMEIRVKNLLISGPTTINLDVDLSRNIPVNIKINAEEGIQADELTIVGFINLYGVDGGPNVSIGIDNIGNILLGIDGLWHFDMLIIANIVKLPLTNVNLDGNINPLLLGFGGSSSLGFAWIHLEGTVKETSTISWDPLVGSRDKRFILELEPGVFVATFEDLETIDNYPPLQLDGFIYSDAPIKLKRYRILSQEYKTIIEGTGYIEFTLDINSFELLINGERDIDVKGDLKSNGDFSLFNGNFVVNGSGECHFDIEITGSILTGNLYGHVNMSWFRTRTRYITICNVIRFVTQNKGRINYPFRYNPDSEEITVESYQSTVVINTNTQYITMFDSQENVLLQGTLVIDENGKIQVINEDGEDVLLEADLEQAQIQGINVSQELRVLFPDRLRFWIQINILDEWYKIWGIGSVPSLNGAVALLKRTADSNDLRAGAVEILPGDKLNFTAWFRPGPENIGPYTFEFNYGDNSSLENVSVPQGSHGPVYPGSQNHQYAAPGTYTATVTITDSNNPEDTITDTTTIDVVEKYLGVSDGFIINFEKISEYIGSDGKIHRSFEVKNNANENYSEYKLYWNLDVNFSELNTNFGTNDWYFDITSGVLLPNESQVVNYSFTPNLNKKGDYGAKIYVANFNDNSERKTVDFNIYYGLVELLPDTAPILLLQKGEIKEFDNVFWVLDNRWETLNWEVCDISYNFDSGLADITIAPNSGFIYPGNPPTPIDIIVDASNENFQGGNIKIRIQRVGDAEDNDTINLSLVVINPEPESEWVTPDGHELNWWFHPRRAHDDNLNQWSASSYRRLHGGWTGDPLILTLDNPIDCNGFRINAKAGDNLDQLEVKLYNDNTLQFTKTFSDGEWNNYDWIEWDFGTTKNVDRVEIRQHLSSGTFKFHWAVVNEFDFKEDT